MPVSPDNPDDPFNIAHYARLRSHSPSRRSDVPVSALLALLMAVIVVLYVLVFTLPSQHVPNTTVANETTGTGPSPWTTTVPAADPSNAPTVAIVSA